MSSGIYRGFNMKLIAILFLLFGALTFAGDSDIQVIESPGPHGHALLVGPKKAYLYHYAFFTHAHRYQLIMDVSVEKKEGEVWKAHSIENPKLEGLFSAVITDPVILPDAILNPKTVPQVFNIKLFQGFLLGGEAVPEEGAYRVKLNRVVHYRQLKTSDRTPSHYEYYLFGVPDTNPGTSELYLAHIVNGLPSFEQVARVSLLSPDISARELEVGLRVVSQKRYPNSDGLVENRPQAGTRFHGTVGDTDFRQKESIGFRKIGLEIHHEYFLEDRLMKLSTK